MNGLNRLLTLYRKLAAVAVPARDEQLATLLSLLPFGVDEAFSVVELASGEGFLASAILRAYPKSTILALDGSESMLEVTAARLMNFPGRGEVDWFDLAAPDWLPSEWRARTQWYPRCAFTTCTGPQKQRLFMDVHQSLSARGALLIADIMEPSYDQTRLFFADSLDEDVKTQSRALVGSDELFERFNAEKWDYYRYPDPIDQPSTLFDQLTWLRAAGFSGWRTASGCVPDMPSSAATNPRRGSRRKIACFTPTH